MLGCLCNRRQFENSMRKVKVTQLFPLCICNILPKRHCYSFKLWFRTKDFENIPSEWFQFKMVYRLKSHIDLEWLTDRHRKINLNWRTTMLITSVTCKYISAYASLLSHLNKNPFFLDISLNFLLLTVEQCRFRFDC